MPLKNSVEGSKHYRAADKKFTFGHFVVASERDRVMNDKGVALTLRVQSPVDPLS